MYLSATTASAFVLAIVFNPIVSANPIEAQANPIEARDDDPCKKFADRTFRILAIQAQGFSGIFSQTFEAKVEHDFDPEKRLAGPEISSCTIRTYGSGCKWTKPETVPLGKYKVEHLVFNPLEPTDGYVKISGDGCKDQKLECSGRSGLVPVSLMAGKIRHDFLCEITDFALPDRR